VVVRNVDPPPATATPPTAIVSPTSVPAVEEFGHADANGGEPVLSVSGVEVVAEPRQVQGDLVGNLGRADLADGGVEVPAGPRLDRVWGGATLS
jgi:hypothetical protein